MMKRFKRVLSFIMAILMVVTCCPDMTSYAAEISGNEVNFESDETEDIVSLDFDDVSLDDIISDISEDDISDVSENLISDVSENDFSDITEETVPEIPKEDTSDTSGNIPEANMFMDSEEPFFWIADKSNPSDNLYGKSDYTIDNSESLTLSVVPKWINIGEKDPAEIPVTYTWKIVDNYTNETKTVEGNDSDTLVLPADLPDNNEYYVDCYAFAEYNSEKYEFVKEFVIHKHGAGINLLMSSGFNLGYNKPKNLNDYNMSWDEENGVLTLSGAYIRLRGNLVLPANATIVVKKGTTNYIYGGVSFEGEGTITGGGTLNIINEVIQCDCISSTDDYPLTIKDTKLTIEKKKEDKYIGIRTSILTVTGNAEVSVTGNTTEYDGAIVHINEKYLQHCGTSVCIKGGPLSLRVVDGAEINGSFYAEASYAAIAVRGGADIIWGDGAKLLKPTNYSKGRIYYQGLPYSVFLDDSEEPVKIVEIQGRKSFSFEGDITGETKLGETLTVGDIMPAEATVEYEWMASDSDSGEFLAIEGASSASFTINKNTYVGKYLKCIARGTGDFGGMNETDIVGPVTGPLIFDEMYLDGKKLEWTYEEVISGLKTVNMSLPAEKTEIVVTGKSENDNIYIDGVACNSKTVNLYYGDNVIDVSVKNSEGTADYKLTVHRASSGETVKVSFEMDAAIERSIRFTYPGSDGFILGGANKSKEIDLPYGTVVTVQAKSAERNGVTGTVFTSLTQNGKRIITDDWKSEKVTFTVGDTLAGKDMSENVKIDADSFFYTPVCPKITWEKEGNVVDSFQIDLSGSGLLVNHTPDTRLLIPKNEYVKATVSDKFTIKICEADNPDESPVFSTEFAIGDSSNIINFPILATEEIYQRTNSQLLLCGSSFCGLDSSKDYLVECKWCEHENEELYNEIFGDCRVRLNAYEEETFCLTGESEGKTRYYISNTPGAAEDSRTVRAYFTIPKWMTKADMENYSDYYFCDNAALFERIGLGYKSQGNGYIEIVAKGYTTDPVTGSANIIIYDTLAREAIKIRVDVSDTEGNLTIHPETTSFSYNIYQNTGYDIVASISGEYASEIEEFALVDTEKTTVSEYFGISEVDYRTLHIEPIKNFYENADDANQLIKKKSVVYYLRAELKNGSYAYSDKPITIKLSKQVPSVSTKAVSFNSFCSDNTQNITFTSKQGTVYKAVPNEAKMTSFPSWLKLSNEGKSLSCTENGYKGSTKLYLNAYVEGYDAPGSVTVSVSAASKVPNVKLRNSTIKVPADKNVYKAYPVYIDSKDKKVSLDFMNITGVRTAGKYDLAKLNSKDAKKYAASLSYDVEIKDDFSEGCFYLLNKDTDKDPVSGTVLLIFTVGNDSKQEFSLPLTVKPISLDNKNKWKADKTSVTLFTSTAEWENHKYIKVSYPVDCCEYKLKCQVLGFDGEPDRTYVSADVDSYDRSKIVLRCAPNTPLTSSGKSYTLVITDEINTDLPPIKVKVLVSQKLPTMSFAKNSATFLQEQLHSYFQTSVKTSEADFNFDSNYLELTEASSKLTVKKETSHPAVTWKLYKKETNPETNPEDYLYYVHLDTRSKIFTVSQNTKHGLFDNAKDEKYSFVLKYKNDNKCKASFKISSLSPTGSKGLSLKADKKSVKLNLNAGFNNGASCDKTVVTLTPSNRDFNYEMNEDFKVYTSSKYKDEAHKAQADSIRVECVEPNFSGIYELTISAGKNCEAGKTYYLDCALNFGNSEPYMMETKPVTIAITVLKDSVKPEFSLKATGYLDINNVGLGVKLTPTIKNATSDFLVLRNYQVNVYKYNGKNDKVGTLYNGFLYLPDSKELVIDTSLGEFTSGNLQPSGKDVIYKVYVTAQVGGNNPGDKVWEIETKPIVITVKKGTAKLEQSTKSVTLYKNDRFDSAYVTINFTESNKYLQYVNRKIEVDGVVLDNSMYDITLVKRDVSKGTYTYAIGFKNNDPEIVKKAKAQTIKLNVYLEGSDVTGKPDATVSISVKVK